MHLQIDWRRRKVQESVDTLPALWCRHHWECDKPNNHPCPNGLYWPSIFFVGLLTLVEWEVGRPGSSDSPCHVSNLPSPEDPRWKHPLFFEECLFAESLGAFCFNIPTVVLVGVSIGQRHQPIPFCIWVCLKTFPCGFYRIGNFYGLRWFSTIFPPFPTIFHQFFWLSKSSVRSWGVKGIDFGLGEFWGETLGSWKFAGKTDGFCGKGLDFRYFP